ncbi:MAG: pseudouridine-5'-phosphate glycosidase [Actinobacteria bacterium]|nr:pseudouridine-5'-phosphate glycosidase [Actinomycetota bacterium]
MKYSNEVEAALKAKRPIVALESTILSHGLPRPRNLEVAIEVEKIVRDNGATPATIAMIHGEIYVGLKPDQLDQIANDTSVIKTSTRDLAILAATKKSAATTVAATAHIAAKVGISVFATGGLGGVHIGDGFDESADLHSLSMTPIIIVCAGVKSILNVSATLERLETLSVPVLGYKTNRFPGFFLTDSGYNLEYRVGSPKEISDIWYQRKNVHTIASAVVIANPVMNQLDPALHDKLLTKGMQAAGKQKISGKEVTPFLLEYFHRVSEGRTLDINIEIIKANSKLAAEIAKAL